MTNHPRFNSMVRRANIKMASLMKDYLDDKGIEHNILDPRAQWQSMNYLSGRYHSVKIGHVNERMLKEVIFPELEEMADRNNFHIKFRSWRATNPSTLWHAKVTYGLKNSGDTSQYGSVKYRKTYGT